MKYRLSHKHNIIRNIKRLIHGTVLLLFLSFPLQSLLGTSVAQAQGTIDIWWPLNGGTYTGTVPFKALMQGNDANQYQMYWSVDNGAQNMMDTNYADYPHKESNVDLTSWNWKGSGPYSLTFTAKDASGNTAAQRTITINTGNSPAPTPVQVTTATPVVATPVAPTPVVQNAQPVITQTVSTKPVSVWWPSVNAAVKGTQPFKAMLDNASVDSYKMYWSVDGGAKSEMMNNYADYPHKEVSVDVSTWNWKGSGPYTITFTATDMNGSTLGQKDVPISIDGATTNQVTTPSTITAVTLSTSITSTFYIDPNSNAKQQVNAWMSSRPADAQQMQKIANNSAAEWFGGWNSNIENDVHTYVEKAKTQNNTTPLLVAYNIPQRDCGQYSAGGANDPNTYKSWIRSFARGIGSDKALVVLEPDALPGITCLNANDQSTRLSLLADAVGVLKANGNTKVYIDAGNSNWVSANDIASRLQKAGINQADGFSLNVSNFYTTADNTAFGTSVSKLIGNKHFVIDTSRNGNGSNGEWCNPSGRALGNAPTTNTGNALIDAYLWLKKPGESDGNCNGAPSAGSWMPEYALELARNSKI